MLKKNMEVDPSPQACLCKTWTNTSLSKIGKQQWTKVRILSPKSRLVQQWFILGVTYRIMGKELLTGAEMTQIQLHHQTLPQHGWQVTADGSVVHNLQRAQHIGECPSVVAQLVWASPGQLSLSRSYLGILANLLTLPWLIFFPWW